jgi:hypothetical protein
VIIPAIIATPAPPNAVIFTIAMAPSDAGS